MTINKVTKNQLRAATKQSRENLSEWLRSNRVKEGITQGALAELAGVDRKTINRIENGHFSPSVDTMTRLAVVLGKKIPQLV